MAEPTLIEPDVQFKKQLLASGGETLKKCFQCGTCTVACPLSPDKDPFPRKEVLWAQWGLKERLMADPDVWLCYQCNDCAQLCPREANPGDVMAVVRQNVIEHYSVPGFLARWVASPRYLPVLFAIPALLMLLTIWLTGGFSAHPEGHSHFWAAGIFAPEGEGQAFKVANFDHFFSHYPIIMFFTGFVGLAMLGALAGLARYWKALKAGPLGVRGEGGPGLVSCLIAAVKDVLTHRKFKDCESTSNRYVAHMMLFYGFAGMFVTTALAAILYYVPNEWGPLAAYPFVWWHPVKVLGNVSGAAFLVGLAIAIVDRLKDDKLTPRSGYADWLFIAVIGLTVITGVICQTARLANAPVSAYTTYFIHLLFVFFLLVYLPYSKFAHLFYRTLAMAYARHCGRDAQPTPAGAGTAGEAEEQTAA
jgi:quinone-modifying oxidoreductase subunit QmoC